MLVGWGRVGVGGLMGAPLAHLHMPSAAGDAFFAMSGEKFSFWRYLDLRH